MKSQHQNPKSSSINNKDAVEIIAPWGLVLLSSLATIGAVLRVIRVDDESLLSRLDHTTLLYLVAAAALLLLRQIKTFSFGDVKLELLERVQLSQVRQEAKLADFDLILPLLLPENERKHLIHLAEGTTGGYKGNSNVRNELRKLRSIGLIAMKKGYMSDIEDGKVVDLSEHVQLTSHGRRWVNRIGEMEDKPNQQIIDE